MTRDERVQLLSAYRDGVDEFEAKIKGISEEAMNFIPPVKDAWSIRAHVVHLLDADMNAWPRIRKAIAEKGSPVSVWDQEAWASSLDYDKEDPRIALDLTRAVRAFHASFLERRLDEDWDTYTILHPERGELTLTKVLQIYVEHIAFHVKYVDRNMTAFAARK